MAHKVDISRYKEIERTGRIGTYAKPSEFIKEISYLSKILEIPFHKIGVLIETVDGDNWIMINGKWHGDLDDWFYECLEANAPKNVYFYHEEWPVDP